jgi:hypothetical protein
MKVHRLRSAALLCTIVFSLPAGAGYGDCRERPVGIDQNAGRLALLSFCTDEFADGEAPSAKLILIGAKEQKRLETRSLKGDTTNVDRALQLAIQALPVNFKPVDAQVWSYIDAKSEARMGDNYMFKYAYDFNGKNLLLSFGVSKGKLGTGELSVEGEKPRVIEFRDASVAFMIKPDLKLFSPKGTNMIFGSFAGAWSGWFLSGI